eukprot:scaffold78627_cov27-Prasinocladus_malaysianus.AAC.1
MAQLTEYLGIDCNRYRGDDFDLPMPCNGSCYYFSDIATVFLYLRRWLSVFPEILLICGNETLSPQPANPPQPYHRPIPTTLPPTARILSDTWLITDIGRSCDDLVESLSSTCNPLPSRRADRHSKPQWHS